MTAEELATCWVPVPLRWRHVQAGDVIVGREQRLWSIERVGTSYGASITTTAVSGIDSFQAEVDPDETVQVLVPVTEADAVELTREQLGARLMERRANR